MGQNSSGLDDHALKTLLPQSPFPESNSVEKTSEITSLRKFSVSRDPLLPLFRMIGLTPRFSAAFSEQIHSDLDVCDLVKTSNGRQKPNRNSRPRKEKR
jgi:hypothetical protein